MIGGRTILYTEDATVMGEVDGHVYFAVADGHGGTHRAAQEATRITFEIYPEILRANGHAAALAAPVLFAQLATRVAQALRAERLIRGGTTFSFVDIEMATGVAVVAHLGDSPVLHLRSAKGTATNANNAATIGPVNLLFGTRDHEAEDPLERARILAIDPQATFPGKYFKNRQGLTIMPTRGFGDLSNDQPVGVISRIPDVSICQLMRGDLLIGASDGLFETYNVQSRGYNGDRVQRTISLMDDVASFTGEFTDIATHLIEGAIADTAQRSEVHHNKSDAVVYARTGTDNKVCVVFRYAGEGAAPVRGMSLPSSQRRERVTSPRMGGTLPRRTSSL